MKTVITIALIFLSLLSISGQSNKHSFVRDTPYGTLRFDFVRTPKSHTIISKKVTFTPNLDDKSLDYALFLFQEISDGSLDSAILSRCQLIEHFSRKPTPDTNELYNAVKKLEKVLVDSHAEDLKKYNFIINPNIHTTPKPKIFMQGEQYPYHNAVIEKVKYDADNMYYIHFTEKINPSNFNKNITGVESIWQQSKEPFSGNAHSYTIIVEVGLAFNQLEVLKKVIDSKH